MYLIKTIIRHNRISANYANLSMSEILKISFARYFIYNKFNTRYQANDCT
ncbi:hypothetical protein CCAL9344_02215 [Campylobacter sp. RM9344]|uniref:Uncharacterized protein n=1 Tax=Campylobacter californiensis TaxID=1032243 RepID=A0AAW3ZQR5_9BACT|nr:MULTISPECIES: hypothetical protein [unclassified Campylobacter]MBE2984621.1 hypothetical protein [Campylobacter sp. RM6883]MBE2986813.1 hypothetical protein [Campylobacter sp. RM12919]MBE2988509.1 hypothetical protein [Campylobacter sp. RM12920]MBE2995091.1 hypothetical protein [Campylobacter sp. RM6913]MBE3029012.1 hypothetical protein [Campylobacter sp. RM9344]